MSADSVSVLTDVELVPALNSKIQNGANAHETEVTH